MNQRSLIKNVVSFVFLFTCISSSAQPVSAEAKKYYDRGQAALETIKSNADYEAAINEFNKAVKLAPDWPDVYYALGQVQEKLEKYTEAIASYNKYITLAPTASNAGDVRTLINKLEYKVEKEQGFKKVFDLMTSGKYESNVIEDCKITGDKAISSSGFYQYHSSDIFRKNPYTGKLETQNIAFLHQLNYGGYHSELHPPIPREWEPVTVKDNFYDYSYHHYMDMASGHVVRYDIVVKGEIISAEPPLTKEIIKTSITWGVPIPGDSDARGRKWKNNFAATSECIFEWKLKK